MSGKYKSEVQKRRADERRQMVAALKLKMGCVDCGYNANAHALEFDHLPGSVKVKTVASMMYSSVEKIMEEIAKCEVVCCNCHAIRTFKRLGL